MILACKRRVCTPLEVSLLWVIVKDCNSFDMEFKQYFTPNPEFGLEKAFYVGGFQLVSLNLVNIFTILKDLDKPFGAGMWFGLSPITSRYLQK